MDFSFSDLLDFSASTGDWMSVIERLIFAIADFLKYLGIDLFATETTNPEETTSV